MFKHKNMSNIIGGGLLGACLLVAGPIPTQAAVIITATETGGDVVFEALGSLNVDNWDYVTSYPGTSYIVPSSATIVIGPEDNPDIDNYVANPGSNLNLPIGGFGPGFNSSPDSGSGHIFGIDRSQLQVPAGYTSGDPLLGSSTYSGHTFASLGMVPGSYTISWAGDSITLNVVDSGLDVDFTADVTAGSAPLTVQFTNLSSGASSYIWIFGDTNTSTEENPSHTYSTAGTYTVSLVAIGGGSTKSLTKTDYIVVDQAMTVDIASYSGIAVTGTVGEHYRVEWQDALVPDSPWQLLEDIPSLPSSPYMVYDPTPISATNQRLYQAVLVQ